MILKRTNKEKTYNKTQHIDHPINQIHLLDYIYVYRYIYNRTWFNSNQTIKKLSFAFQFGFKNIY